MAKPDAKKRQREAEDVDAVVAEAVAQDSSNPRSKKARVESNRSLFVRSLPPTATGESLTEFFSQHYPVKHATVVLDPKTKTSRGYGFVTFTDPDDAVEAKQKLNNELLGGRRLRLDIAEPRHRDGAKAGAAAAVSKVAEDKRKREEAQAEARKAPKLIIRNLPWSIKTPEQLAALFKSFGKVKFADLPNEKGKLAGFGFITLRGKPNAEKAMEAINGKEVDGRTLAVDWAVDKQTWEQQKGAEPEEDAAAGKKKKKEKKEKKAKDEDDEDMAGMSQEDRDLAMFMKNHMEDLESEDDSNDEKDKDEDDEDDDEDKGGADIDEEEEEDVDMEDDEEEEKAPKRTTDNSTVLFIRNLPYTTTDEQLKTHFTQFGAVRYARVVMDRATDRPAGTGFVCFFNPDDCMACLKGAPRHQPAPTLSKHSVLQDETVDPEGKYTMEGRILQVAQAVNKDEAARLQSDGPGARKGQDKDKRRLFLLQEGDVSAGSALYKKLTPSEIKMREASMKQRKKLIQSNPALHLSLTRLALRNIPRNIGSKELKALAREAVVGFAKDVKEGRREPISKEENARGGVRDKESEQRRKQKGQGVVKQAKIVFETKEGSKVPEAAGAGRSRGYGFIEYSSHRWALMGLRYLNGHPVKNELGKTQRLIVEFAIENANVVQRRRQLEERNKLQQQSGPRERTQDRDEGRDRRSRDFKDRKGKKGKEEVAKDEVDDGEPSKKKDAKLALRTKIIARKRSMRKKKAVIRGKK
ncbi:nucleolar protein 4 [Diplogelasinospora grovesii]|uniref:Nucleolar protein 4 n=1 Tax=Diplogelasinospora grovesii TaxID=303347 RepID=A0AAN6S8U7_9PEZI|nr:nucleolar protein 4 [Diplogelasinospora grovesii]